MSNLYGILSGYNNQEEENIRQRRGAIVNDSLADEQRLRRQDQADLAVGNKAAALAAEQGVMPPQASAPTQGATPQAVEPSLAVAGVAPEAPKTDLSLGTERNPDAGAGRGSPDDPPVGAKDGVKPPEKMPPVTITAKKEPDFNASFQARRDALIKIGRADLAANADAEWNKHLQASISREAMNFAKIMAPEMEDVAKGDLAQKKVDQGNRLLGSILYGMSNPVTAALSVKALNDLNSASPIWRTGQKFGSLAKNPGGMVFLDDKGAPILGDDNKPLTMTTAEYERLVGLTKKMEFKTLAAGETAVAWNSATGQGTVIGGGGEKPPTAHEKATEQRQQIDESRKAIKERLQVSSPDGLGIENDEKKLARSEAASLRAAELVAGGMPGIKAGYQAVAEVLAKEERELATQGKRPDPKTPKSTISLPSVAPGVDIGNVTAEVRKMMRGGK